MHGLAIAIYAMLAASCLPVLTTGLAKVFGRFKLRDNINPRAFQQQLTGVAARLHAAQNNSYETLPVFLAAVLTAEYMVVAQPAINILAWAYVGFRVLYIAAYAFNFATLRSIIWVASFFCPLYLFYISAHVGY
jgi:uncharacterized MAPEG superfamily protein